VEVFSIAKAESNPHTVEVLPSYMVRVSRAKVYLKSGLALDGWADAIIAGSRNRDLRVVDCSRGIEVLEKPQGKVDASMGDVHPEGNPHWWLDPRNGVEAAGTIEAALEAADPAGASAYQSNLALFRKTEAEKFTVWKERMKPLSGASVFTYHSSWPYFTRTFGMEIVGKVEPVPGIPPNARHLQELVSLAKSRGVEILLQEPYFQRDGGEFLSREAGVRVVVAAPSSKGVGAGDYFSHFDDLVTQILAAKARP